MPNLEPIKLSSGGTFVPLNSEPFQNQAYRVDPSTLPDLPAGITLEVLHEELNRFNCNNEPTDTQIILLHEIAIRQWGYLPVWGPDGYDQFGYNRDGLDENELDRNGLPSNLTDDPMLDDERAAEKYARTTGAIDTRTHNTGKRFNRGNEKGQTVITQDGTQRSLGECWYDMFVANEVIPVQERLADEEIIDRLATLFPNRQFSMKDVRYARWRFNQCELAPQATRPTPVPSYRYVKNGGWLHQTTPRCRVLKKWNLTDVLAASGQLKKRA
jgi:hypothetical protein